MVQIVFINNLNLGIMKKVFMSLAIVAAMFAAASCACCGNKCAEEASPCENTCCETKACCDTCTAVCDSAACAACDSTAADCAAKAE